MSNFGKGIPLVSGFDLGSKKPLDSRIAVQNIQERDAHVANNRAYEGLRVYVIDEGCEYLWNGNEWLLIPSKKYVDDAIANIEITGGGGNHYLGDEEPTDDNAIWFSNETNYQQQITYDNPIIQEILSSLRSLKKTVEQLQSDVEYLKANGGGSTPDIPDIPDIPDSTDNYFFLLEDGGQLLCEDGSYLVLEDYVEELVNSILTLENGSSLLLEDGSYILLEETIQEIQDSLLLLESGAQLLLESGHKIILER